MIKIKTFENVYGIRKLNISDDFGKVNIIYAPNGTAKTSISDALYEISNGRQVSDVYGKFPSSSYELDVDGKIITQEELSQFNVVKYSGVSNYELDQNNDYSSLVLSEKIRKDVFASIGKINKASNEVKLIVESVFGKKKKIKESFYMFSQSEIEDKFYSELIEELDLTCDKVYFDINIEKFINLSSTKAINISQSKDVKDAIYKYIEIVNKKISDTILDDNFTLENLEQFLKAASNFKYFSAGTIERALLINGIKYNEVDANKLLNDKISEIYGSEEVKEQFNEVKKAFKGASKVEKELKNDPKLVTYFKDYKLFINKMFVTLMHSYLERLINEKNIILIEKENLKKISEEYSITDNKLYDIWEKFKTRFKFNKFELGIENEFDAVAGISMPKFVKYIPGTTSRIKDPEILRFSTGEIKSFNVINAILEIERNIISGENFTLILDDAVDSFDYKNKYGMLDYLLEIKDKPNIQMIIFTHNFDFYRSSILAFGKTSVNQYFAYKNNKINEIVISNTKNKQYYLELTNFNNWKSNPSPYKYFALIPFARNVLQLQTKGTNDEVVKVSSYLHYTKESEEKKFEELQNILFDKMRIKFPNDKKIKENHFYLYKLDEFIAGLFKKDINETDLDYKLAIGIYIRIFLERYLMNIYYDENSEYPIIDSVYSKTNKLIQQTKAYLSNDEVSKVLQANLISPSYVHANSFMYEPLIDVGTEDLVELASWLHEKNKKWPLKNILSE